MGLEKLALWRLCARFAPTHVYMSVLNYLFPERVVGKKKAKYAYPVGGEYVIDVDNYLFRGIETHEHPGHGYSCHLMLKIQPISLCICSHIFLTSQPKA
ncbi:MAG: hypothetical protein FGF48_07245 [Candidatus Brockarchaeota archaeon]|nr:hypothetical protein [Candidatus Brockarchaeota archaeon]